MKKIFAFILTVVMALTSVNLIWAEEVSVDSNKIEISFKVGDEILKINGEDVQVEKPVVINGVTLVPVRVISEAFGADVTWNEELKLVTLTYSGVNIMLYIDNKTAIVDGNEITLLEAPRIINSRTMVPLRFITENFGADVDYQSDTKLITVIKEIVSENSIKDFGLVLKKTNKTKVGDSYHSWSMDFPKTLKLEYRNFTGTINAFSAVDESYSIILGVFDKGESTIESLKSKVLKNVEDYTLLYQGIEKEANTEFVKIVWRDKTSCCEYRAYFSDENIYEITTTVLDYNNYIGNEEIQKQLNSFNISYLEDGITEDLSDVDENGYRPYDNKNLKVSFKIMADWIETTSENKENEIFFYNKDFQDMFYCTMFSYEKGLTLEQLVEREKKKLEDEFNPAAFRLVKVEDSKINGVDCKLFNYILQLNTDTFYCTDVYVIGENYIYNIGCNMTSKTYNDPELRLKAESAVFSFKYEEPDPYELGLMLDANNIEKSDEMRNIDIKDYGCSIDVPVSWIEEESDDETLILSYSHSDKKINVSVYAYEDESSLTSFASDMKQFFRELAQENKDFTLDNTSSSTERGMEVEKFNVTTKNGHNVLVEKIYLVQKDGRVYMVELIIDNVYRSEKNIELLDEIWNSFQFED